MYLQECLAKIEQEELEVDFCVSADLTEVADDRFVHPAFLTFMEGLDVILKGTQQVNAFNNTTAVLEFLQHARHPEMPVVQWAGFNRAFPLMQGITFDVWRKSELKILRDTDAVFRGNRGINNEIHAQLQAAGFQRSLQAVDKKRRDLGLMRTGEQIKQEKLQMASEIEGVSATFLNNVDLSLDEKAEEMSKDLKRKGIVKSERLCKKILKQDEEESTYSTDENATLSAHEKRIAAEVREKYAKKSDHRGMAKVLRDRLKDVTNRSLESCQKYLDDAFAGDLARRSNWKDWEYAAIDEVRARNPDAGRRTLVPLLVQYIKEKHGEKMVRTNAAYDSQLQRYKSQATSMPAGSNKGKRKFDEL